MIVEYTPRSATGGPYTRGRSYPVVQLCVLPQAGDAAARVLYRLQAADDGTPAPLMPAADFRLVDGRLPDGWCWTAAAPADMHTCGPAAWAEPGFWERLFDGDAAARACFEQHLAAADGPVP